MLPPARKRPVPSPRVALSQNDSHGCCLKYLGSLVARLQKDTVTGRPTSIGNRLLAALPPADFGLLTPHFQKVSFEPDAVLVRSGDELDQVYFPHSGAIAFMVDMPDGQTVATTLMGREGALASLSVLGPSRSSVTAIARMAAPHR